MTFRNNTASSRYELEIHGHIVFADYYDKDGVMVITHVEAPPVLRGTGAAGKLMEQIAQDAQAQKRLIRPLCGYAATWLQRHSSYRELVA